MATIAEILTNHLPYELDMLDGAFKFLRDDRATTGPARAFLRNAAIEVFWLHARNLIEFLAHPKNGGPMGPVSAKDFTVKFDIDMKMKRMDQRVNAAITHLLYERKTQPEEKLAGYDMERVKEIIDREINRFEKALLPEYASIWKIRQPTTIHLPNVNEATNYITMSPTTTCVLPTGPLQVRDSNKRDH